jgi:hypothetical protein
VSCARTSCTYSSPRRSRGPPIWQRVRDQSPQLRGAGSRAAASANLCLQSAPVSSAAGAWCLSVRIAACSSNQLAYITSKNSRARQAAMDVCTSTQREPPRAPRSSQFA